MNTDEIQNELDRLWKRVTSPEDAPASFAPVSYGDTPYSNAPSITREVSLEAIALLKRQHREELLRLQQFVELKERSSRELAERLAAAEQEVANQRRKNIQHEEQLYQEVLGTSNELEAAQRQVAEAEKRFHEEETVLRSIADSTRKQLASETARWREFERQAAEREQEYLLQIRSLEARSEKAQEDSARNEGSARRATGELQEAKGAIEGALGELLKERHERETADAERDKALSRVKEVEEHVRELQNLWQEERAQWQELWDRERSTWESQRQQFAAWEEKVRKDRESFHSNLQNMEERETRHAQQMGDLIRNATDAGEKVTTLLQRAGKEAKEAIALRASLPERVRKMTWRQGLLAGLAVLTLASAYPIWMRFHRLEFVLAASHALPLAGPTGMAYEGNSLWLSQWNGDLVSVDPRDPAQTLRRLKSAEPAPYHPVALAVFGDALYSLDSAQGRILRHPLLQPDKVQLRWPSPGPAPLVLTHDGQNLWSYDAATHQVYRHLGEGPQSQTEAYRLPMDVLPSAMGWLKDELFLYDAKGKQFLLLRRNGKSLELVRSRAMEEPVQALVLFTRTAAGKGEQAELWTLSVPASGGPALRKYHVLR